MVSVFGLPPLAPNRPLPRAIFDGICDVLCTSSTPQKRAGFLPRGGGSAAAARLPIAKAKATPHAMRSNMPGIRCLVHRRIEGLPPMPPTPIKQGSMDRAKGFTHIPQEIKNGNHHASIHPVHFGKFFFSLMYGQMSRNDVFGRCGCLLGT